MSKALTNQYLEKGKMITISQFEDKYTQDVIDMFCIFKMMEQDQLSQ